MSNARLHRYYLQQHAATEFIVACYINMGITAFAFRNYESIPFFGESSIVVDMLSTGLILPIIVGLIAVARVRKHIRAGELPPLNAAQPGPFIARILPSSLWLRAVVFAIYGVLAAMLALIALRMLNIDAVPYWPFVIFCRHVLRSAGGLYRRDQRVPRDHWRRSRGYCERRGRKKKKSVNAQPGFAVPVGALKGGKMELKDIIGFVAGFGTTFAALPDLIAMLKRRSSVGMNPRMAAILGAFQILWVVYGLMIESRNIVMWNVIAVVTNYLTVGAYLYFRGRESRS
jgi:uncharacterized protein with PQ loop repeat